MKTSTKLLTLVLVLPLLAGCGKVKEPKFANKGNKVEYETFSEAYLAAALDSAFVKEDLLGSMKCDSTTKGHNKQEIKREKKLLERTFSDSNATKNIQFDFNNKVLLKKNKNKATTFQYGKSTNGVSREKGDSETYHQNYNSEDKSYVIEVDNKEKSFKKNYVIDETNTLEKRMDYIAKSEIGNEVVSNFSGMMSLYSAATDEEKAKYSFYNDSKVFTIEYESTTTDKELKDSSDVLYAKESSHEIRKVQLSFGESYSSVYYVSTTTTTSYVESYGSRAKGDVKTVEDTQSKEVKATSGNVNVSAISTVDYIKYGESW